MTGYTDIEENVLEFFKQNNIVGSIFVNTDTIGKHGFMDMESLKKIDKYISVYSHGKKHINYGREYTNNNISKEKVLEYIDNCDNNEPIFMDDIKRYVIINMDKDTDIKQINNNINVIIYRLLKDNKLKTKYRGIYYKPTKTLFGETTINI